jgi:hypothetical protein
VTRWYSSWRRHDAQTYRERGRKRSKTIRFDYRVPNG